MTQGGGGGSGNGRRSIVIEDDEGEDEHVDVCIDKEAKSNSNDDDVHIEIDDHNNKRYCVIYRLTDIILFVTDSIRCQCRIRTNRAQTRRTHRRHRIDRRSSSLSRHRRVSRKRCSISYRFVLTSHV